MTHLHHRRQRIVELIAQGMDNGQIAQQLHFSPDTVSTDVKRLLRELGARNRAHAVAQAHRLDRLHEPTPDIDATVECVARAVVRLIPQVLEANRA